MAEAPGVLIEFFALKAASATLLAALLGWRMIAAYRMARRGQLHALDPLLPALEQPSTALTPAGFAVVQGRLDGHPLRIELFPDNLVMRALPVLWLEARWRRRHRGRLRVTVRPNGAEYFAENGGCTVRLEPPPAWAEPVEVWGAGSNAAELLRRLESVELADFPSLKQVLVTENELRVTLRCKQGDRAAYRVLRAATFDDHAVSDALVAETMNLLHGIERALEPDRANT